MMEFNNICPICLRNDRQLKVIVTALSEYHDEITNHTLPFKNQCYCSDCECMLRKTYSFQQKCVNASKILEKWMNTSIKDKTSANMLHLKLPPISLGTWTSDNNKVFNFTHTDDLEEPIVIDYVAVKPDIDTLLALNTIENLNSIEKKDEFIESLIPSENLCKVELKHEHYQTTGTSDISFQSQLLHKDSNDGTFMKTEINVEGNVIRKSENKLMDVNKQTNRSITGKVEVQTEAAYVEVNIDNIIKQTNSLVNNMASEPPNNKNRLADNIPKINKNVPKVANVPNNKTFINYTEGKDLELIYLSDDVNKNDNAIVIDDENEYSDDASLNSNDDCDDYLHSPPRKIRKKKITLDELANIDLSDEDLDEDYISNINRMTDGSDQEDFNIDKLVSTERTIISKLKSLDKTLDSIFENWEVTSLLIDMGVASEQRKDEIKKMSHTSLTDRTLHPGRLKHVKGPVTKVAHINTDLDLIIEKCVNTVEDYKFGLCGSKERLKAMLKKWGKLKKEDGSVFDKNVIIDRLGVVNERIITRLYNLMHGKKRLSPDAVKLLTKIQNKKLYTQYESVFDIEYLTTEKDKLEEFERRKTYECYVKAEFKCDICYQGLKSEKYLDYHRKQYHDKSKGQFSCHICHVIISSKKTQYTHKNSHLAVYKCKLCPLVTHYRGSMINHYEQHKGTVYDCEKCGQTFKSKSMFLFHQSRAHPRGDHVCSICGNSFISEKGLHSHVVRKHPGESPVPADGSGFSCEECNLTFPSEKACFRHRRITHGAARIKGKHLKITRRQRKKPIMTCPECKAVGHSHGWMVKHFDIEHPSLDVAAVYADKQIYLCDICGKGFRNKYLLREHIDFHSGVTYPCPSCKKQCKSPSSLRQHQLWHGPPGYCCERCGKKFHSNGGLNNHMRTHIGDRRFKCHICEKGFLYRCSLTAHVRGVHNHERRVRKQGVTGTSLELTSTESP